MKNVSFVHLKTDNPGHFTHLEGANEVKKNKATLFDNNQLP